MEAGRFQRVILITLDGVGVGALPDAALYGDEGANTLLHVAERCGGLCLPNLRRLGLGNILQLPGVPPHPSPGAAYGRLRELSAGKDTTTGHWELAGVVQHQPLPTYPTGFPAEIIAAFSRETGLVPLGNCAASGTEILNRLGEEHLVTGSPIVYTSTDSVFQIAAHEEVIPPVRLYEICRRTRRLLDPYRIGRVIARPFVGRAAGEFRRTANRQDFSLPPLGITLLDRLVEADLEVFAVGKINDIFCGRGITHAVSTCSDADGMARTIQTLARIDRGLVFTNLVDFDTLYGHRLDWRGFGAALEDFDRRLAGLLAALTETDLLIITADHGCDPTTAGTDHTREHVPVLLWSNDEVTGNLGTRPTFADVGATIAANFRVDLQAGVALL